MHACGAETSQSRAAASRMSVVCEGLQSLDAELHHYQEGFGELLSKVKQLQQVVTDVERQYRGADDHMEGVAPSSRDASPSLEVPEGGRSSSVDPCLSLAEEAEQSLELQGQRSCRASMRDTAFKLMSCWTSLQELHEETHQTTTDALKQVRCSTDSVNNSRGSRKAQYRLSRAGMEKVGTQKDEMRGTISLAGITKSMSLESSAQQKPFLPFLQAWLPQSSGRLLWDFVGLILLCYDTIVIPVEMAWDLDTEGVRYNIAILALVYWTIDFVGNFNTAYYQSGQIVLSHREIALHYLRTWLLPDISLITIDYILLTSSTNGDGGSLRSSRFIRISRLARLIKMSKTTSLIDSMAVASGCAAEAMILLPILKTLIFILVGVHMTSCSWFYVGRSSMEDGDNSWLVSSGSYLLSLGGQYVHAFRWVLCQFTPATNDVNPQNVRESTFAIITILLSVTTMGASLGRISTAVQQLNAMKFAKARRLREIRLYLLDQKVSPELSNRILTFAEYSLQQAKGGINMDFSLISVHLRQELLVHRSGDTFSMHPLMQLILTTFPDVFMRVCELVNERVYEKDERVFRAGSSAQCMYVITNGEFVLKLPLGTGAADETSATSRDWFTDIALFTHVVHVETLESKKFGRACTLEGAKFAQLLQGNPACAEMVIDFASHYLQVLRNDPSLTSTCLRARALQACENTQAYQWLTGKLRLEKTDFNLPGAVDYRGDGDSEARDVLRQVLDGTLPIEDVVPRLPKLFPELQSGDDRIYTRFHGKVERCRAGASILSVLALLTNRYDLFTAPQIGLPNCMSEDVWQEMQLFVQWAGLSEMAIHSVLVFLAIRGAGKIKCLVEQLPSPECSAGPETATLYMMQRVSSLLPSSLALDDESRDLVVFLLEVQREFHIPQFMQGETVARSVACLAEYVQGRPTHFFQAYLLSFVGIMCGISAGEDWEDDIGSHFMTQENALTILEVLRALQKLNSERPQLVYWGYMEARARRLDVPLLQSSDDVAYRVLARFLCLCRAQSIEGRERIEKALQNLDESEKRLLENHFLAGGSIEQPSYVLAFLPACLANAQSNPAVGFQRCLSEIAEIYGMLDVRRSLELAGGKDVKVDLSEFSNFIAQVRSASVFSQCVENMKIRGSGVSLSLSMSTKSWSRVWDDDVSEISVSQNLKHLIRQQETIKEILRQIAHQTETTGRRETHGKGSSEASDTGVAAVRAQRKARSKSVETLTCL